MSAPEKFASWMSAWQHIDEKLGFVYRYHSRGDAHSIALSIFIAQDLLERSALLRDRALRGEVAYGINVPHTWPNGKAKTIDLAIGRPKTLASRPSKKLAVVLASCGDVDMPRSSAFTEVCLSCEAKTVMTEHGKSQPRVYDELSSSHEIVHQGRQDAIAAGITVVNVAPRFISPLRQRAGSELHYSIHRQPHVAARMVNHLRGLPIRENLGEVGFDAYCTLVIDCNNQEACTLSSQPPAPQSGDRDHYETFIDRIARFYSERFSSVP